MEYKRKMKFYITGTRRGLGKALLEKYDKIVVYPTGNMVVGSLIDCDVFINCKHDKFEQVELLYKAGKLKKKIINIGSLASDYTYLYRYGVEKKALREANHQLFNDGIDTTIINFGYIDTERVQDKDVPKMSVEYCCGIIHWVLQQPNRIKEIPVCPPEKNIKSNFGPDDDKIKGVAHAKFE